MTSQMKTSSSVKADPRMVAFAQALESSVGDTAKTIIGENGSDMYSIYGVNGEGHPIIGKLVGMFSGIVDNSSPETCSQFVRLAYNEIVSANDIGNESKAAFLADLIVASVQCRDIRNNGKGRRDQSRAMFLELVRLFPDTMLKILPEWKEYGSWKDYNLILQHYAKTQKYHDVSLSKFIDAIYDLYVDQLKADRASFDEWHELKSNYETTDRCEISLAAKWLPKENRSLDRSTKCFKEFAKRMFPEAFAKDFKKALKQLRQFIAPLQDAINTTEKLECANRFDEIRFQLVPGKCLFKKKKAYLYEKKKGKDLRGSDPKRLECRENLMHHLTKAVNGKATIHGKTVYIHELCHQVYSRWNSLTDGDKLVIEAQWLDHVKHFRELMAEKGLAINKGVVLADFSGSMSGDPMNGAMAIAILASTLAEGPFKDRFMSFESTPQWISLQYPKTKEDFDRTLGSCTNALGGYMSARTNPLGQWDPKRAGGELKFWEKVGVCYTSPWGGNTDFLAAHDLILDVCVKNNVSAPEWMIVASDMQFDQAQRLSVRPYPTINSLLGVYNLQEAQRKLLTHQSRASYTYNMYGTKTESWQDHHTILQEAYKSAGVNIPMMIYWNMRSTNSFVTTADKPGVQMVGGFSTMQLKLFLEEMELDIEKNKPPPVTPWDTFRKAMDNECYLPIRRIIHDSDEKHLNYYRLPTVSIASSSENCLQNSPENGIETSSSSNIKIKLTLLKDCFESGLISQDEYIKKKEQLLVDFS